MELSWRNGGAKACRECQNCEECKVREDKEVLSSLYANNNRFLRVFPLIARLSIGISIEKQEEIKLVYVIGLQAVQFGNNWVKKIPRTAKIGRGRRPSPIWLSEEFFEFNYFQFGQECSPLTY